MIPTQLPTRRLAAASLVLACVALVFSADRGSAATVDRYWEYSPYRIQVLFEFQTSHVWQERLQPDFAGHLLHRSRAAVGPLWRLSVERLSGAAVEGSGDLIAKLSDERLAALRRDFDKVIVILVTESKTGFRIASQEHDCLLESWGPMWHADSRDGGAMEELAFAMMRQAFTPMATFRVDRENREVVQMQFRGAKLPATGDQSVVTAAGQVYRPYLRRVDRNGQPVENGIQQVPWTYLVLNAADGEEQDATIVSHTPVPFAARQRGRVDQLAQLVRPGDATTKLRLHARDHEDQPLAGFRVYATNPGSEESEFLGTTNDQGSVEIPTGESPVQVVYVQSGGQWIAKIPVVPSADGTVSAPLADDRNRLEAEAKLVGIREELIDMVARRNILAARTRAKIKAKDLKGARALVRELESMPSATEFEQQRIRQQERLIESDNPQIQQRIEKMFNDTRDVLGEFLAPGLVQELKAEVTSGSAAPE